MNGQVSLEDMGFILFCTRQFLIVICGMLQRACVESELAAKIKRSAPVKQSYFISFHGLL